MLTNEPPWDDEDWDPTVYRYQQIAAWCEARIKDGRWPAKTVLSEVELQHYFRVGRNTIRQAFALLRERRLIVTLPAKGSVVIPTNGDVLD